MNTNNEIDSIVSSSAARLRKDPKFDPRREKELNEIYNQYIPPHSNQETSHLLDVAERDSYIDPFPPIGSQKMAGAVIKKGIRTAIGWYIQYIAQQISTFGSGVSQALSSLHSDVEDLKKSIGSSDISKLINKLDLGTIDDEMWSNISPHLPAKTKARILISDVVDANLINGVSSSSVVVVDPRSDACDAIDPKIETRCQEILGFTSNLEPQSVAGIVLHGRIDFLIPSQKVELINVCAKIVDENSSVVFAVRTINELSGDAAIARELTNLRMWSATTWKLAIESSFSTCQQLTTNTNGVTLFIAKNSVPSG